MDRPDSQAAGFLWTVMKSITRWREASLSGAVADVNCTQREGWGGEERERHPFGILPAVAYGETHSIDFIRIWFWLGWITFHNVVCSCRQSCHVAERGALQRWGRYSPRNTFFCNEYYVSFPLTALWTRILTASAKMSASSLNISLFVFACFPIFSLHSCRL